MTETLAHVYSSESTELSNEYKHDRVEMFIKNQCILVLETKVALALEGLTNGLTFKQEHVVYSSLLSKFLNFCCCHITPKNHHNLQGRSVINIMLFCDVSQASNLTFFNQKYLKNHRSSGDI